MPGFKMLFCVRCYLHQTAKVSVELSRAMIMSLASEVAWRSGHHLPQASAAPAPGPPAAASAEELKLPFLGSTWKAGCSGETVPACSFFPPRSHLHMPCGSLRRHIQSSTMGPGPGEESQTWLRSLGSDREGDGLPSVGRNRKLHG